MELWKPVPWYELYQVSTMWRIKSLSFNHHWQEGILKSSLINRSGYARVTLRKDKKNFIRNIHRLVAQTFIPNPENKPQVNHKDWNKLNNRLNNLERVTASENNKHKFNILWYKNIMHTNNPSKWKTWNQSKTAKKVWQYTLEWLFIKEWWSIIEAGMSLWRKKTSIGKVCRWECNYAYWYKRKYL